MTRTADEVLDAIDGALDDWAVSDDAMRWVPPEERPQRPDDQMMAFPDEWASLMNGMLARMAQAYEEMFRNFMAAIVRMEPITLHVAGYRPWDTPKPHTDVEAYAAAWLRKPYTAAGVTLGPVADCPPVLNLGRPAMQIRFTTQAEPKRRPIPSGHNPSSRVANEQRRRQTRGRAT